MSTIFGWLAETFPRRFAVGLIALLHLVYFSASMYQATDWTKNDPSLLTAITLSAGMGIMITIFAGIVYLGVTVLITWIFEID